MTQQKRPRTARGQKPGFFDDPGVDKLVAISMALAGEISVLRDRLDSHERFAQEQQWPTAQALEAAEVSEEVAISRQEQRDAFVERVFRAVTEEVDRADSAGTEQSYSDIVDDLSK